jgi:hypothetical protein
MHHAPWHGEWRVDEPYPFCTTVGSMPIKALAMQSWEFWMSWQADDCRLDPGVLRA